MAKGAVWMVLFKFLERSLGLLSTLVLVRVLEPADFGLVAMALSFIAMVELLTSFGFDISLIQSKDASKDHFNTAWTCNLLLGTALTSLMLLLAAPIANFYHKPELTPIVCALAFGPLLSGCENIGVVAFRKELDFRREFMFQLSRKVISFAVVVPLALLLRSYWALVAGVLASRLAGTTISYVVHPFRPRFALSRLKDLFRFSRWLLLNNMLMFFKERSSDFFIGRLHGAAALGAYNISYELANLPTTELSAPINRALLPGFARMTTPQEVGAAYANAVGMLALLTLPAVAGIFAVAPHLVPVIFGAKWLETIPLLEVLCFNGALLLFHSSICAVLIGRGFPAAVLWTNVGYVLMLLASLGLLSGPFGVTGAAYAALATSLLFTPVYVHQTVRCLGIGPMTFVRAIIRPLIGASFMAVLVRWALPPTGPEIAFSVNVFWLLCGVGLGVVTYLVLITSLWCGMGRPDGPERVFLNRLRALLANLPPTRLGPRSN